MNQSVFASENSTDTAEKFAVMTQIEYTDFSYFNASIFNILCQRQSDIQISSFLYQVNSAIFTKGAFSSDIKGMVSKCFLEGKPLDPHFPTGQYRR